MRGLIIALFAITVTFVATSFFANKAGRTAACVELINEIAEQQNPLQELDQAGLKKYCEDRAIKAMFQ